MQEAIRHGGRADDRPTREQIEPAARALVERHSGQLIATARRYSLSAEDAEDAFQRGLEILLTRAPSLHEEDLVPWLKTVVKHEAFTIRKRRQRDGLTGDGDLRGRVAPPTDEQVERHERLRVGVEAMSRLKPQELRCLLLRAEGYSYKQICDETGWTYTKVNRSITEGRRRFLDRVAGIESGAECERLAPLLSRLVDGEATAEDMAMLRPHIRSCLGCRATLRDFREAPARVAAFAPLLAAPHLSGRALHQLERMLGFVGAHKTAAVVGVVAAIAGGGVAARHAIDHGGGSAARPPVQRQAVPRTTAVVHAARKPVVLKPRRAAARHAHHPTKHRHSSSHRSARTAAPTVTAPPASSTPIPPPPTPAPTPHKSTTPRASQGSEFGP